MKTLVYSQDLEEYSIINIEVASEEFEVRHILGDEALEDNPRDRFSDTSKGDQLIGGWAPLQRGASWFPSMPPANVTNYMEMEMFMQKQHSQPQVVMEQPYPRLSSQINANWLASQGTMGEPWGHLSPGIAFGDNDLYPTKIRMALLYPDNTEVHGDKGDSNHLNTFVPMLVERMAFKPMSEYRQAKIVDALGYLDLTIEITVMTFSSLVEEIRQAIFLESQVVSTLRNIQFQDVIELLTFPSPFSLLSTLGGIIIFLLAFAKRAKAELKFSTEISQVEGDASKLGIDPDILMIEAAAKSTKKREVYISKNQFRCEHWHSIRTLMHFSLKSPRDRPASAVLSTSALFAFFVSFHRDYRLNGFTSSAWGVTLGTVLTVGIKIINGMTGLDEDSTDSADSALGWMLRPGVIFGNFLLTVGLMILIPQTVRTLRLKSSETLPWELYSSRFIQGVVELVLFDMFKLPGPRTLDPFSPYLFQYPLMRLLHYFYSEEQEDSMRTASVLPPSSRLKAD